METRIESRPSHCVTRFESLQFECTSVVDEHRMPTGSFCDQLPLHTFPPYYRHNNSQILLLSQAQSSGALDHDRVPTLLHWASDVKVHRPVIIRWL